VTCCAAFALAGDIRKDLDVRIRMRDGVHLSANVFRPSVDERLPALLVRTPYGKGEDLSATYRTFVEHGYAVVVQDVRGRHESEGRFDPFRQEGPDGYDTLNWIAEQPWSNGKVGMLGGSYLGIVQWRVAELNNPHLKAISPVVSGGDDYRDRFYSPSGAMKLGHRLLWLSENFRVPGFPQPDFNRYIWHVPLRTSDRSATGQTIDFYQTMLNHPAYDSFWKSVSALEHVDRIRVPVFSAGGWFDNFVESDLAMFQSLAKRSGFNRIMIGPWPHNMSMALPGVDYGPQSKVSLRKYQLEWFDYWLKFPEAGRYGVPAVSRPRLRIFVMGDNVWRDEQEWPLARTRWTPLYLSSKGHANGSYGNGRLERYQQGDQPADRFVYDPHKPVPTMGGAVCCDPKYFPWGPKDQRPVEKRPDVLVFTGRELKQDLEVTGPVRAKLYVSTSAPDTDFTAKLVDVFPDGTARNVTDGILRLRYRDSLEKPALAKPGEVYLITIDTGVTSNVFQKGHRIRVEIASSNFPRFSRNLNTGRTLADDTQSQAAAQTIYHDRKRPSHLILPVIP
jgi:putative CocE/NonD family hydrolase